MKRCALWFGLVAALVAPVRAQLAVRGETVYPVSGPPIKDGIVLVEGGKIRAIGAAGDVEVPDGWPVHRAKVVTPGLIDARSVVGLAGIYNRDQDQEQIERSAPIQPELRALDAFNHRERLVAWLREHGITTVNTGPAPATLVCGQSMIIKTRDAPRSQTVLKAEAMVLATLGDGGKGSGGKGPGTRAKQVALLRQALIHAREYAKKRSADGDKKPPRDLRKEVLADVLEKKKPLAITAHRDRDILTALRLQKEFGFDLVLDGAAEVALVLDEVKAAGVPVLLHAPMIRTRGERENASFETGVTLKKAGVLFTYQSGFESYVPKTRVILFEAAIGAANGLGMEGALRAITLDAAQILGIEARVGSLEKGKDADLVLFDGDPFEYTTHVLKVLCDGEVVSARQR